MAAIDVEDEESGRGGVNEEEGAGREEAVMLVLVGDCDGGGAAEDEAVSESDTEGKTKEVEGPVGGLGEVWFWLLFRE